MVRAEIEDNVIGGATLDADRVDAAKKELLGWFRESLQNEPAPLVNAAL